MLYTQVPLWSVVVLALLVGISWEYRQYLLRYPNVTVKLKKNKYFIRFPKEHFGVFIDMYRPSTRK